MSVNIATLDDKGLVRVTKRKFKSIDLVDIRKFYRTDDDEVKPGRQGLSLTMSQWEALGKFKDEIDRAFDLDEEISLELSVKKRASVQCWNAKMFLDLREYYEKDGEKLPGKKGIKLTQDMWNKLSDVMSKPMSDVKEEKTASNSTSDGVEKKRDREEGSNDASTKRGDEKRLKTEAVDEKNTETKPAAKFIPLNEKGTRRFLKRTYKGTELYDIREFYDANGEMKPGRKGISLREDQWNILVAEAQSVNELLKPSENHAAAPSCFKKNASGESYLELSNTRRLTVREWKGRSMVDIREFYRKEDALLPGKKGISLTESQWENLVGQCM